MQARTRFSLLLVLGGAAACGAIPTREEYLASHPDLSPGVRAAIELRELRIGMPADAVAVVMQRHPDRKKKVRIGGATYSCWVYPGLDVYVDEDGKVARVDG